MQHINLHVNCACKYEGVNNSNNCISDANATGAGNDLVSTGKKEWVNWKFSDTHSSWGGGGGGHIAFARLSSFFIYFYLLNLMRAISRRSSNLIIGHVFDFELIQPHSIFWPYGSAGHLDLINTLKPRQNGRRFADDTFLNENVRISIEISLKFVPKGPINNIPSLV